jgi:hypothetical protein
MPLSSPYILVAIKEIVVVFTDISMLSQQRLLSFSPRLLLK